MLKTARACASFTLFVCLCGCARISPFGIGDEGEWLADRVITECAKLQASGQRERTFEYVPRTGAGRHYRIKF
ncbi:MAG TPA: hypothetical protein VEQ63_02215, partial [Bryobacteraceae bacterium]|nr:hypothetical protein [Bryobacteraceae bacterium]